MENEHRPLISLGRRVKLKIGEHWGHITDVSQKGRFTVTFDGGMASEGGRTRRRSGGRYSYPLASISQFEVGK